MRVRLFMSAGLLCLCGCGAALSKNAVQSAQVSLDSAMELEKSGKYDDAIPLVTSAVTQGGLNGDQLCEALLLRSRCYSLAGQLDEATKDLEAVEQGSPNPASWHYSRAVLFAKQNKNAESKAEFAKALKIDPKLKMPK
jgi:tetratricopeptide (TPR) repeat protein